MMVPDYSIFKLQQQQLYTSLGLITFFIDKDLKSRGWGVLPKVTQVVHGQLQVKFQVFGPTDQQPQLPFWILSCEGKALCCISPNYFHNIFLSD